MALLALAVTIAFGGRASADEVAVPIDRQVDLLAKVASYDKNLPARAGDRVRVLVLTKQDDAGSSRVATQIVKALAEKQTIANLPHEESVTAFSSAAALAKTCTSRKIAIVYLTPGFTDAELVAIAKALDGVDVLTTSAVAGFVPKGIVLGFDLVSGKPKLLVHLTQARRQNVALSSDLLKLVRVYE